MVKLKSFSWSWYIDILIFGYLRIVRSNRSCVSDLCQYIVIAWSRLICTRIERSDQLHNTTKHLRRPKAPINASQKTLHIPLIPPGSSRQHKTPPDSTRQPQTAPTTASHPQSDFLEFEDVWWCLLVSVGVFKISGTFGGVWRSVWGYLGDI